MITSRVCMRGQPSPWMGTCAPRTASESNWCDVSQVFQSTSQPSSQPSNLAAFNLYWRWRNFGYYHEFSHMDRAEAELRAFYQACGFRPDTADAAIRARFNPPKKKSHPMKGKSRKPFGLAKSRSARPAWIHA